MDFFTNAIPVWVSILLIACFFVPIFMIVNVVKKGCSQSDFSNNRAVKKLPTFVVIFFIMYYLYVAVMSFTGIFQVNTLPPRILLLTAIPLTLFYFLFVHRTKVFRKILENVKLSDLVRIHIFRLIGAFFLIGWYYGLLPKSFAFIAGIGDILVALTAIVVAVLIDKKANHYQKITLIWNIIGFGDIVSVILSAVYLTQQAIENNVQGILEMTKFPYSLIPAFAPATIVFLHICIFKKIKLKQ